MLLNYTQGDSVVLRGVALDGVCVILISYQLVYNSGQPPRGPFYSSQVEALNYSVTGTDVILKVGTCKLNVTTTHRKAIQFNSVGAIQGKLTKHIKKWLNFLGCYTLALYIILRSPNFLSSLRLENKQSFHCYHPWCSPVILPWCFPVIKECLEYPDFLASWIFLPILFIFLNLLKAKHHQPLQLL